MSRSVTSQRRGHEENQGLWCEEKREEDRLRAVGLEGRGTEGGKCRFFSVEPVYSSAQLK